MSDAWQVFIDGLDPETVERERLGDLEKARGEAFSRPAHRAMLAAHEMNRLRFRSRPSAQEAREAATRAVYESALYESRRRAQARREREAAQKVAAMKARRVWTREEIDAALAIRAERKETA